MKVDDVALEKIHPYGKNPRINDDAVDAVVASMNEFGVLVPIVLDSDYTIIAGHTRYKAAQKRGMDSYPCLIADNLTDEQVRAYRLADNKTAEIAIWDRELLDEELQKIEEIEMDLFGFEIEDNNGVSYLESLMEDEFSTKTNDPKYFEVSFVFGIEHKETINKYLKDNGKDEIVDLILKHIEGTE